MRMRSPSRTLLAVAIATLSMAGIAAGQALIDPHSIPLRAPGPPVEFGTTEPSHYSVAGGEFISMSSSMTYSDFALSSLNFLRYATTPFGGFMAGVRVPDGAVVTGVEWNLCDSSVSDDHVNYILLSCQKSDGLCSGVGDVSSTTSNVGTPCASYVQDLTAANYVADSSTARLLLFVVMSAGDATNALAGATVAYQLQVSPAPGTATFGDVPTGHPFFQFVEALAKSGITGGCGGGNYCPDNPVTRGQMAVFLAKALGLQFP